MSDEKALLASIWEQPHEDTPRLVYADWVQENGQPERAEFIRLQCALARMDTDDPERAKLEKRERHLWTTHGRAFRRGLPDRLRSCEFHRGFVAPKFTGLTGNLSRLTGHKLLNLYLDLFPAAPLWDLTVSPITPPELATVFADERFARVGSLRLHTPAAFVSFVASPHARNLSRLHWSYAGATADGVRQLCESGTVPHLSDLALDSSKIGDEGLAHITGSPIAGRLKALSLSSCGLGPDGVRAMAASRFAALEKLSLGYDAYSQPEKGDAMVAALTTGTFPRLRYLRLFSLGLTNAAAFALAAWPGAMTLRHLQLHGDVTLRVEGVRAMAASPYLRDLEVIDLFPWAVQRDEMTRILTDWLGSAGRMPDFVHGLRGSRGNR